MLKHKLRVLTHSVKLCLTQTMLKHSLEEERAYLTLQLTVDNWGMSGRDVNWARTWCTYHWVILLAGSCLAMFLAQPNIPGMQVWCCQRRLSPPMSIKTSLRHGHRQSDLGNFQLILSHLRWLYVCNWQQKLIVQVSESDFVFKIKRTEESISQWMHKYTTML